jgi:hypothetical protein
MCFHCVFTAETSTSGTFHMFIPKYTCTIYSTWNAVLLVFWCVFIGFSLQKHVSLVHFTCIPKKLHISYILHEMHSFGSVSLCFHCVFNAETCTFGIFHLYTKIHMYHIFYMKCTNLLVYSCVFTVFSLCFYCRNMYFLYISNVYQNTHVPYILHEMHSFASVFMCFNCVFTAKTCSFGTFHMYIPKYT